MFPHKIENNSKLNPTFYLRSNSCPNIYHYVSFVKEEAPKSISSKSLECFKIFRFSLDNQEHTSEDEDCFSSSGDSTYDYERFNSKVMNANCKEATSLEEKILVTKNKLQPAFHLPSSSVKYQEPSFCCEEIPEIKKIAPKDDSSSDSGLNKNQQMIKLSETLSRPLRIEPPSDGPRSEWLPPIPTEQQNESKYSLQSEQVLEPVFLPQQKSFPKWKTGRQSPLPTGTQVRAFQNLRGQSNPRSARSYTMTSSGRDDIQHAFENIQNDYELSFQERRRRCQTRYPRPQIIFRNQPRISWRKRIRRFARDIRRFVQNLFNRRRT